MEDDLSKLAQSRNSPRAPLCTHVELPRHAAKAMRASEVSLTGMRALSRGGLITDHADEKVHMRFKLPGMATAIEATARVVSQRAAGDEVAVGLCFETLSRDAALSLYRFVSASR